MRVVSAGVHDAGHFAFEFEVVVFEGDGEAVDVSTDGDSWALVADVADQAAIRAAKAAADVRQAHRAQLALDDVGGALFVPAHLGMFMQLAAHGGHVFFLRGGEGENLFCVHG